MEKDVIDSNDLKRRMIGKKNSLKKNTLKTILGIGLFLFFVLVFFNTDLKIDFKKDKTELCSIHFSEASAMTKEEAQKLMIESIEMAARAMGFSTDGNGKVTDPNIGKPTGVFSGILLAAFEFLLNGVLLVVKELAEFSGMLLDLVLKYGFTDSLLKNEGVYRGWAVVRDILNMFFMLLLLFSAFATIFQVEKYHLRKVIIMLVVMALLVNFSYPVTMFVIDFSNSAMFFLIDNTFSQNVSASGIVSRFVNFGSVLGTTSQLGNAVAGTILSIIITFIIFITFISIALNLLIRILAFVILLILAPAGFSFAFFPDTKNIANDWWSALFKYAFMGPVMVFFLYLGVSIFDGTSPIISGNPYFAKELVRFIVPVAFLWMGLIASNKFGGSGAGFAMGLAKKTGNNIKTYGQKAAWSGFASTGIPGAFKERYADIKGGFSKSRENREAKLASLMGSKSALSDLERKRYEEDAKKMKNYNNKDLEAKAEKGNIAAADELLSRKSLTPEIFNKAITNSKDDKRNADLIAKFKGTNKDSRIDVVASIDARKNARDEKIIAKTMSDHGLSRDKAEEKVLEDEIKNRITKMNQKDFISQDFEKIYKSIDEKLASSNRLDNVEGYAIRDSIHEAFRGLDANGARGDIIKNLSKNQYAELDKDGVV